MTTSANGSHEKRMAHLQGYIDAGNPAIALTELWAYADELAARVAELEAENDGLNGRRREGRQLLARMVKYVREDRAQTPGKTRLARLVESVADYLNRTADPRDTLR